MGNKDRLAELQRQSKHAPVTEEEEMEPLNKNKKKQGRFHCSNPIDVSLNSLIYLVQGFSSGQRHSYVDINFKVAQTLA